MASNSSKHSLYKLASPARRGVLQQGKLQELSSIVSPPPASWSTSINTPPPPTHTPPPPFWSDDDHQNVPTVTGGSPRRPPPPPTPPHTATPSGHTHSLSLSNSSDDSPPEHYTISEPRPPTHIVPSSLPTITSTAPADNSVLLLSAMTTDSSLPSHTTEVEVSSVQVPSPVKVIRHSRHDNDDHMDQGDNQWRRFSSDFASLRDDPTHRVVSHDHTLRSGDQLSESHDASHDQTLRSGDQLSESHDHHHSQSSLSTTMTEDSINLEDVRTALDSVVIEESGMVGSNKSSGIGRSVSAEVMGKKQNRSINDSVHSKSVELSAIHEDSLLETTSRKQSKKGRVVASRYMSTVKKPSSTTSRKTGTQHRVASHVSSRRPLPPKKGTTSNKASVRSKTKTPAPAATDDSFKVPHLPPRASQPFTQAPPHTPHSTSFNPLVMSTPAYGGHLHDGSFINTTHAKTKSTRVQSMDETIRKHHTSSTTSRSDNDEREKELLLIRLLQATYLDVMSSKALTTQEEEAKTQLYTLWKAVEDNKDELHTLQKNIVKEERNATIDRALDVHLQSLGPLGAVLPKFQQHYASLARSLDVTRNEMALHGVLPCTEDEIEAELGESEQVLGEVMTIIRDKVPKVSGFATTLDSVLNTVQKEHEELEKCGEELGEITKDQLFESSLFLEEKQRKLFTHEVRQDATMQSVTS